MRNRPGWVKTVNRWPGVWKHTSGWLVRHCGHPTALWPYWAESPDGKHLVSHNGRAFRKLIDCQAEVEKAVAGAELVQSGFYAGSPIYKVRTS